MFIYNALLVFFHMLINSIFKVTTGLANVTRITSCTDKFINYKRLQKIWYFIFSWELFINFKRSKNNFKISIFEELFADIWQLFLNLLWIFSNVWKFIKTLFIRFWIRLINATMHIVQTRLCNSVNQKWWKRITF